MIQVPSPPFRALRDAAGPLLFGLASMAPALAAPAAAASVQPQVPGTPTVLRATQVHVGDGTVIPNGVVVVVDGVIQSVGKEAPDGVEVVTLEGHLAPGFVAMRDATGTGSESNETTRKLAPTLDLARAFDPHHPGWASLLEEGITTVLLTPDSSRIAGGVAAAVSPASGTVVKRDVALCLGMSDRSLENGIEPTSYAGLYASLDTAFAAAKGQHPMARAKAGSLPVMIEAISRVEVQRAAAFAKTHGLKGALLGAPEASEVIGAIQDAKLAVVFEPMKPGGADDVIASAIALAKAGVPFAFTVDANGGGAAAMRMTVAACMRGGLDPKAAMSAMSQTAAQLAGVGKTRGTIAKGKVADLVLWTGAPTDLTSRVTAVYAAGTQVHGGAH